MRFLVLMAALSTPAHADGCDAYRAQMNLMASFAGDVLTENMNFLVLPLTNPDLTDAQKADISKSANAIVARVTSATEEMRKIRATDGAPCLTRP